MARKNASKRRIRPKSGKSSAAQQLGRKGGLKGGAARAQTLASGDRSRIARLGGLARTRQIKGGG